MRLAIDQDFPADIDKLWSVFSDPEYPRAKYTALGATFFEQTRFSANERSIEVELSRRFPVDLSKIPSFAHKFVGNEQVMRHITRWSRVSATEVRADLTVVAEGRPVKIAGTARIAPHGQGITRLSFALDITSDVPLLGGKIEKLFFDQVTAALAADHKFTLGYLERATSV